MGQEEGPLALTEISSGSEYESKSKASTGSSFLLLYILSPPILLPLSSSPSPISPLSQYNMSQYSFINYEQIIQQQQEQLVAMQAQIQALLATAGEKGAQGVNIEVAKPQVFNGSLEKVSDFVTVYKLYLRMKMREAAVKK